MKTESSTKKGKAIEHYLISELLKHDFDVYCPVVDEGIDFIVRDREGGYVDIQVKSRKDKGDFFIKPFKVNENFFIVCHNLTTGDFFMVPSSSFYYNSEEVIKHGIKNRRLSHSYLEKCSYYKGEEGLRLLKRALENPHNKVGASNGRKLLNQA